jgi:hypothetical protein
LSAFSQIDILTNVIMVWKITVSMQRGKYYYIDLWTYEELTFLNCDLLGYHVRVPGEKNTCDPGKN